MHTRGISVLCRCAGEQLTLPGMVASMSPLPVIGVPVNQVTIDGWDSILSIHYKCLEEFRTVALNGSKNAGI
jgi:5-(carboxyamino)imidazole ribonucleotide mutase